MDLPAVSFERVDDLALLGAETPRQLVFEQAIDELLASVALGCRRSQNAVMSRGQKNTERMLKALLGALGFEHVEAVFAEPPKT